MEELYELKLIEKLTTKRHKNFYVLSQIFQLLHLFLVKADNAGKDVNIAFKPYLCDNEGELTSVSFFSKNKNDLELFESVITGDIVLSELNIKLINEYFLKKEIKKINFNISESLIYKRKRLFLDSISHNKLKGKILYVIENSDKKFEVNTTKGKIQLLVNIFKVTNENVNEYIKEIQERLKRDEKNIFVKINSASSGVKDISFSFRSENVLEDKINYKVNRYGLSTDECIFPIPV